MLAYYSNYIHGVLHFKQYFLLAALVAFMLTPLVKLLASKIGAIDRPSAHKLDKPPVPLLGGVAIFAAFIVVVVIFNLWSTQMNSIVIASAIIVTLGTWDDIKPLSSRIRLMGQIVASGIVMSSGLIVSFMPDNTWGTVVAILITLIWIVGIINAMNFADGLDGLATGIAIIAIFFFFLISFYLHQYEICILAAVMIGSGLGFLCFNFKPAKIYLGDGGSTLLGFWVACIALYGGWSEQGPIVALGIPVIITGVLIFDMIYITLSRIKNGHVKTFQQWLDYVGKDHFHHRLLNLGFSERSAVLFIYLLCVILGLNVLILQNLHSNLPILILLAQAVLIFVCITLLMLAGRKLSNQVNKT